MKEKPMSEDDMRWLEDGIRHRWLMPYAPRWKRLPVIRRFRAFCLAVRVDKHNDLYAFMGLCRSGYDEWVLYGIARGFERTKT